MNQPYSDVVGFWGPHTDIVGQNGGVFPNYQCAPQGGAWPGGMMAPPAPAPMPAPGPMPAPVAAGMGLPLGYPGFLAPTGAGYPLGFPGAGLPLGVPGFAGGEFPVGVPGYPGYPGLGPYGYGYGCFGPPVAPLLTQRVEEPALLLRPRCPTRFRTQWLGFEPECLGPCETKTIECNVNVLTKIIRLVFPSNSAFQLLVHQIEIGNECLIQCGPIPAAMFLEDATDAEEINTETIQPGTSVRITVQNISDAEVCVTIGAKVRVAF